MSRVATVALSVATAYGGVLIAAAFIAAVYRWESVSEPGELARGSQTLVGVNGPGAVFAAGVPLLASLLVAYALRLRSRRWAVPFAWTVTGLLAVFNLLAIASIGLFILPATVALIVACAASPHRPRLGEPQETVAHRR